MDMAKQSKYMVMVIGVFFLMISFVGIGKAADAEFTLKFGHVEATTHAFQQTANYFASEVNKKTNGRVKVSVFPTAQLGSEMAMLDSLRVGAVDMAIITTPNLTGHVPEMGILSVPYMYKNADHIYKVATDKVLFEKYSKLVQDKKLGFRLLTFLPNGLRNLYTTKKVAKIEDLQGIKIRVMAAAIESEVWKTLGATPTTIPFGEVYTALQTNLVQGAENSASSYLIAKHSEVAKFYNKTGHEWNFCEIFASDKTWAKLPADLRTAIMGVIATLPRYGLDRQLENDKKAMEEFVSKGGVTIVDVDTAAFRNKVLPIQDRVAKELKQESTLTRIRELEK
jgi:TRAP-type transport system periplasmic protein